MFAAELKKKRRLNICFICGCYIGAAVEYHKENSC